MSSYKVNCIFLPAAYHPAALLSLFILSSPPCILIIPSCPPMSLTSSLFLSNILFFSSSHITSSPRLSASTFSSSSSFLSCRPALRSLLFLAHHLFCSCLISSAYSHSYLLPPSPPTPCRRLKYEETIKLWLISIWTGGRQATAHTTTVPWKSTAELFFNPRNDFLPYFVEWQGTIICQSFQAVKLPSEKEGIRIRHNAYVASGQRMQTIE